MTMTLRLRKLTLTTHITSSVGWLGAVAGFLALAVAGLTSQDAQMARAAYVAMELTTWFVIVPLAFASLLTGLVVSLGTSWGLFQHYWVLMKLLITILGAILLMVHTQPIGSMAGVARGMSLSGADFRELRIQLVADAVAALVVLLVATTLAVYKPRGLTPYGQRKPRELRTASQSHP
jgi:quinol-cytochrome oxidoreductase complex cytochrome b subunit